MRDVIFGTILVGPPHFSDAVEDVVAQRGVVLFVERVQDHPAGHDVWWHLNFAVVSA